MAIKKNKIRGTKAANTNSGLKDKDRLEQTQARGKLKTESKKNIADWPADIRIPIVEEHVRVAKRLRSTGRVVVRITPIVRRKKVELPVTHEEVDVERVPINKIVEKPFPQRQEGDTTIIPIFEEELVVTKQLILKEEVRITRRQTTREVQREVNLRSEAVNITRSEG